MASAQIAPYGTWRSPISAADVFAESIGLRDIRCDGATLTWAEARPEGRTVLVARVGQGQPFDVTPPGYNVRTRVHEYGGAAYTVAGGMVYFANFVDQRLYRQPLAPLQPGAAAPDPLTPTVGMRYADLVVDRGRGRLLAVREDHTTGAAQPVNTLVSLDLAHPGDGQVLASGYDFYAGPRLSPDGTRLAWLAWNHPNMPWDGCELWLADLDAAGAVTTARQVAGGLDESIFQPAWGPDGLLYFVSDRTGWWNLYRLEADGRTAALHPMAAEFGLPQWVFGMATYALVDANRLVCSYLDHGIGQLATLDLRTGALAPLELPYTRVTGLQVADGKLYLIGGSATSAPALVRVELDTAAVEVIRRSDARTLDPAVISAAQPLAFPTAEGQTAYGFFYPPHNPAFRAPAGERPPLLVMSHGGPTGGTSPVLDAGIQFWTTRGFAVLDVDYGGSTGYGRAYRERLNGQWGIVDVADCVHGARYLVEQGLVDGQRLAIEGGSAGGFTTLAALTFADTFTAGTSYFGVSDLEALALETHKFESRYLDGLVGAYPAERATYVARSPIHHTEQLSCPMLLLQGLDDPIVPPNQAERMLDALRRRGLPVAYVPFPGEQHGFVKAENNRRALEAQLYFYGRIFGFTPADELEPIEIENLPA